jgi:hypothetical protein
MYRRGYTHLQPPLRSSLDDLPTRDRGDLEQSWAGTFYREFFARIEEDVFEVLYSDKPSRPNVAVNQLVAFEVLKAGHGWSDADAYDAVRYNVQVRYAVGLYDLGQEVFTLRTVYNFRRAVADHMSKTGENLFEQVFNQVTGEQLKAYELRSARLRMDSTQVASNIRNMSRLQLLVEVLQRVHRMLDAADRDRYAADMEPYLRGSAGQYAYHMRGEEPREHLNRIGELMKRLVDELGDRYGRHDAYAVLRRVLREQFVVAGSLLNRRRDEDVSAKSLQSPDDPEATYRKRGRKSHRGYVANLTETCDDGNDVQLIVHVAVQPNSVDDARMLVQAIPDLVRSTEVKDLHTDGGYNSAQVDAELREHGIDQHQTAIRGRARTNGRLGREDFEWQVDERSRPTAVTCPTGQTVAVTSGRTARTLLAEFQAVICRDCPLQGQCPSKLLRRRQTRVLRFSQQQVDLARRIRRSDATNASSSNRRASVEATVWSAKCRFPRCKVPLRTKPCVARYVFAASAMVNIRRLNRRNTAYLGDLQTASLPLWRQSTAFTAIRRHYSAIARELLVLAATRLVPFLATPLPATR